MYSVSPVNSWKYCDCENNNLGAVQNMKKIFGSENKLFCRENSITNKNAKKQPKPLGELLLFIICI